jgi:hypothetical protein
VKTNGEATPIEWHHGKGKVCCMASFWNIRQTEKAAHKSNSADRLIERTDALARTLHVSLSLRRLRNLRVPVLSYPMSPSREYFRKRKLGTPSSWSRVSVCSKYIMHGAWIRSGRRSKSCSCVVRSLATGHTSGSYFYNT